MNDAKSVSWSRSFDRRRSMTTELRSVNGAVERARRVRVEVRAGRFDDGALEARQRCAQLLVGASVDAATHRSQKIVQRERDAAVGGRSCFVISMQQLDVHVLVERSRQTVARRSEDAPARAGVSREGYETIVSGVAQPEERKRLQRAIENDGATGGATADGERHCDETAVHAPRGQPCIRIWHVV